MANLRPLASELFDFLSANFIGYYGRVLGAHGVHSVRQFSVLDVQMCRDIAAEVSGRGSGKLSSRVSHAALCSRQRFLYCRAHVSALHRYLYNLLYFVHRTSAARLSAQQFHVTPPSQSHIEEFGRLWPVVELSKSSPESQSLSERLVKFVDKEAHWAAALYSTQAVDILMRKHVFAFVQMASVTVLIFVGFVLTLSPLKMERVRTANRAAAQQKLSTYMLNLSRC